MWNLILADDEPIIVHGLQKIIKTFILKIEVQHFVPLISCCQQLLYMLIQHVRLASASYTYQYATWEVVRLDVAWLDYITFNLRLVVEEYLFQQLFVHIVAFIVSASELTFFFKRLSVGPREYRKDTSFV